jgi:hypothetical protein
MIATMSSWTAGAYLVPRYGSRLMLPGLALLLAGVLAAIAAYHASDPAAYTRPLLAALAVAGLGAGLFTTPFFTTALHTVTPQETGSAAGLLNAVPELPGHRSAVGSYQVDLRVERTIPPAADGGRPWPGKIGGRE